MSAAPPARFRRAAAAVMAAAITAAAALAGGCAGRRGPVVIGMKSFSEQAILAQVLSQLIAAKTGAETRVVNCGDTFGCRQALRDGKIDVMVEYTGTASVYSTGGSEATLADLRRLYRPLGIRWLVPLGFDNGYRVVVASRRARALGLSSIADLARIPGGIRIACPPTYLHRPRDGLAALLARHGLRAAGAPLALKAPDKRVAAVLSGRADAAVVYTTDAALEGQNLTVLRDSLHFFPPYQAVILARSKAIASRPQLGNALRLLSGRISAKRMRQLNYAVQREGWSAASVARRFLRGRGISTVPPRHTSHAPALVLAVSRSDRFQAQVARAIHALREVFPDRPVRVVRADHPAAFVHEGRAQLAVLGAERFFRERGGELARVRTLEADAVVGTLVVHVLRRRGAKPISGLRGLRIGVGPVGSDGALAAEQLLRSAGLTPARHAPLAALAAAVAAGKLDAAIVLAEPGDTAVAAALHSNDLVVTDAHRLFATPPPYMRQARLVASTYPGLTAATDMLGQAPAVATLSAQVVIAGPSRVSRTEIVGGPAAALPFGWPVLTVKEARKLAHATGVAEVPDPVLPSVWTSWQNGKWSPTSHPGRSITDTLLNLFALAFTGWLIFLMLRARDDAPDDARDDARDDAPDDAPDGAPDQGDEQDSAS